MRAWHMAGRVWLMERVCLTLVQPGLGEGTQYVPLRDKFLDLLTSSSEADLGVVEVR